MAGLIKNQILKHLSKFVKNLSPSQISLSALRGEGELTNLELNVEVLGELLELPTWVRLTQATCNRAAIRIQWTKLKSVPIQLNLDEIRVRIETCEELRTGDGSGQSPLQPPSGTYGFTEKIVDGISITVNLVHVSLTSLAFTASFQMSRIVVESRGPAWQKTSLPHTRLKDLERGEVLTFKELSWQTVRIEARSTVQEDLTPLRLITNQARCRVTLKKRMSDCGILGARIVLILDDLLWVLTDDQLKAALHFMGSVSGLVKKATEKTQAVKAGRKLEHQKSTAEVTRRSSTVGGHGHSRTFKKYDVLETSYHFYTDRIDLHFCDDPGGGRSEHPQLEGGGAFQVSLARLQADYYPYHLARGDRKHWVRYSTDSPHRTWLQGGLAQFDTRLLDELLAGQNKTPLSKAPLSRGGREAAVGLTAGEEGLRDLVVSQLSRMMVAAVVLRLADVTLWRVSTSSSTTSKAQAVPVELLKGDSARLHLPPDLPLVHLELSQFYYPGHQDFPLPPPCLLLTANPITIWLDVLTLVWLNSFALNLQKSVAELQQSLQLDETDSAYADVKVEVVMPRLICSPRSTSCTSSLRPASLQASASKVCLANYRSRDTGSRADLAAALDKFQQAGLFFGASFPSRSSDPAVVHQKLVSHATGTDTVKNSGAGGLSQFRRDLLWTEARDVWHVAVDSVWAEFVVPGCPHRPVPLLDAAPLQCWIYVKPEEKKPVVKLRQQEKKPEEEERPSRRLLAEFYGTSTEEKEEEEAVVSLHVLALSSQLVSLQLDHQQLLFLLRLAESLGELGAFLAADSARIEARPAGMVLGAVLPQVDLSIILPVSASPGQEGEDSEGGEGDSVLDTTMEELLQDPVLPHQPLLASSPNLSLGLGQGEDSTLSHPLASEDTSHPLASETSHPPVSEVASHPLARAVASHPLAPSDTVSSEGPEGGPAPSLPGRPSLLSNGLPPQPPPKVTLCPTLSSNGLPPELASALASLQVSGLPAPPSPSGTAPQPRRGLWGLWGESKEAHPAPPRLGGGKSPDLDNFDTLSVRSDDSGESTWTDIDGLSVITDGDASLGEALFRVEREEEARGGVSPCLEVAEEAGEASLGEGEGGEETQERRVSVLTLHLGGIAAAQISGASSSSLLLTADSLGMTEGPPQDYNQFQFRFGQSGKAWSESTLGSSSSPTIAVRLDSRPPSHPALALSELPSDLQLSWGERIARATEGRLEAEVSNLSLATTSSTVSRLGEWLQDEVEASPLPLSLSVSHLSLTLTEDSPQPPGHPSPPPLHLAVPSLQVSRGEDGVLVVKGGEGVASPALPPTRAPSEVETELRAALQLAREEVRVLRAKMAASETRSREGEDRVKEAGLKVQQCDSRMEAMVLEKKGLLDTLRYLQEELLKSGKK